MRAVRLNSVPFFAVLFYGIASTPLKAEEVPPLSEEMFWNSVPVVMSATRMSQPVVDAPVAVTVISREMIEASGAREIPELFRLVPGFMVGYHDGHTPSVSYHMSQDRYARRMQVLIDGRSVYTTAIGGIPWATLHITMDDIDRIEVVRGPNSASYGANSFLGVINIITRHAVEDRGSSVKARMGDEGVKDLYLRHGGYIGKLDYRVAMSYESDDGFHVRKDWKWTQKLSFRADYSANATDVISMGGGVGMGPRGVENRLVPNLSVPREKELLNHHQHIKWERTLGISESLSVQLYHIFQRNFETFLAGWVIPADLGRRTDRYEVEFQHNTSVGETLRLAWGGGIRQDTVWAGETLFNNQEIGNHLNFGFANVEWNPFEPWLVNLGVMVEDYTTTGTDYSPRLGLNYRWLPNHSIRLSGSKAIRTPSMFEYAADYALGRGTPFYDAFWIGTHHTNVEHITAYELGFNGHFENGLNYDIKLFQDNIRDLILLYPRPFIDADNVALFYENHDCLVVEGVELELNYRFPDESLLHVAYANTEIDPHANNVMLGYENMAPKHNLGTMYIKPFGRHYRGTIEYFYFDSIQEWEGVDLRDPMRRLDLKVSRTGKWYGYKSEVEAALRNVLGKYEAMEVLRDNYNSERAYRNLVDPSLYVSMKVHIN